MARDFDCQTAELQMRDAILHRSMRLGAPQAGVSTIESTHLGLNLMVHPQRGEVSLRRATESPGG